MTITPAILVTTLCDTLNQGGTNGNHSCHSGKPHYVIHSTTEGLMTITPAILGNHIMWYTNHEGTNDNHSCHSGKPYYVIHSTRKGLMTITPAILGNHIMWLMTITPAILGNHIMWLMTITPAILGNHIMWYANHEGTNGNMTIIQLTPGVKLSVCHIPILTVANTLNIKHQICTCMYFLFKTS